MGIPCISDLSDTAEKAKRGGAGYPVQKFHLGDSGSFLDINLPVPTNLGLTWLVFMTSDNKKVFIRETILSR